MDKEEKEIEMPAKAGKGAGKKRGGGAVAGVAGIVRAPSVKRASSAAPPHPAAVVRAVPTPPAIPTPAATPPATHTGLPQQVRQVYSLLMLFLVFGSGMRVSNTCSS